MPPTTVVAPACSITRNQDVGDIHRWHGGNPWRNIPVATDLASLLAAVNALRDVLRQFTGQWTVNNVFEARTPNTKKEGNKYYSEYPEWAQVQKDVQAGFVFHKDKSLPGGMDRSQAAYVVRINRVTFQNEMQPDPEFNWSYVKRLDG